MNTLLHHAAMSPLATNPNVTPNWTFFPFMGWLQNAVGGVIATVLVILIVVAVVGALVWAISKMGGAQRAQGVSGIVTVVAFAAAVLVGSAAAIVTWSSGQNLGF